MSRAITVHQVDVFTRSPFEGNPAGVVPDADGLSEAVMRKIAREMNLSETVFVFAETGPGIVPVRFFTPAREVPACGHATLAAHFVRAARAGAASGSVTQVSPGARWEVRWEPRDGATMVIMRQGPVEPGPIFEGGDRRRVLEALRVTEEALVPDAPVRVVSTGHSKIMVPVASPETLLSITPDMDALASLSGDTGVSGYFLFAPDENGRDTLTVCRMFGPALGIPEDPVNGSGHGPLGAYLIAHGGLSAGAAREGFWSRMGDHLGRPGRVSVRVLESEGVVEVGGFVTPVFTAEMIAAD